MTSATTADKTSKTSKTESFTVAVHTAVLQQRDPKTERLSDKVLRGGETHDLDPTDEFVERLIDLKVLRRTKDVEAERDARRKLQQARAEYMAKIGELERERIAAATGDRTPGVVEAGQPDAAAATPDDDVVDVGGPNAVTPVVPAVQL